MDISVGLSCRTYFSVNSKSRDELIFVISSEWSGHFKIIIWSYLKNLVILLSSFVFGAHPAVLRDHSEQGCGDHVWFQESNLGHLHAKQAPHLLYYAIQVPYLLYYLFGLFLFFSSQLIPNSKSIFSHRIWRARRKAVWICNLKKVWTRLILFAFQKTKHSGECSAESGTELVNSHRREGEQTTLLCHATQTVVSHPTDLVWLPSSSTPDYLLFPFCQV